MHDKPLPWKHRYEAANDLAERLQSTTNIQKAAIDELRTALQHAVYRTHEPSDGCAGCRKIEELLKTSSEAE